MGAENQKFAVSACFGQNKFTVDVLDWGLQSVINLIGDQMEMLKSNFPVISDHCAV